MVTSEEKRQKLQKLIADKMKLYEKEQLTKRERVKKAKRNAKRQPVPEGETDYNWCDYPTSPTIDIEDDENDVFVAEYSNGIRVR